MENKLTKKKVHPNTLANLRPAKKGEIRNPLGYHSHDPVKRAIKKLSGTYVNDLIEMAVMGRFDELEKIINTRADRHPIQVGLAKALHDACAQGNWPMIERIIDRVLGKTPETLNVNLSHDIPLTEEQLREKLKRLDGTE